MKEMFYCFYYSSALFNYIEVMRLFSCLFLELPECYVNVTSASDSLEFFTNL